ncbi:hypothetical protein NDU88_000441 [Pleurodeles waltl]|uniref:Uncharacterized protein n=1 Tax=Pleurodeles waltl TaxID=8319 RepID=A0AAV7S7I3_PLEWA|nr:hypothetical protein NDU88_000441 [Pleurodeles waltl]
MQSVPDEYRLWNRAEVWFGSISLEGLMPAPQSTANAHSLQLTKYEFLLLVHNIEDGFNSIKEELLAMRITVLQNRLLLGMLTATEVGVCAKIGSRCYTFVPGNDEENGTLTNAIQAVHTLRDTIAGEQKAPSDWFSGLVLTAIIMAIRPGVTFGVIGRGKGMLYSQHLGNAFKDLINKVCGIV